MKQIFTMIMSLICLGMGINDMKAQTQQNLSPLLEQADTSKRDTFNRDLDVLLDDPGLNDIQLEGVVDDFFNLIIDGNSFMLPPDAFSPEWNSGQITLIDLLENSGLSEPDAMEIGSEYDSLNDIWNTSQDSFSSVLDLYEGPIDFNPDAVQEGQDRYDLSTGLRRQSVSSLNRRLGRDLRNSEPLGPGNLKAVLDNIFSSMFKLELAFGKETGDIQYYNEQYRATTNVLRVGSVPEFDRTWEAKWHLLGAFLNNNEQPVGESAVLEDGPTPLRFEGNFSCMFNPGIGRLRAGGRLRLYTSLGLAIDSYLPAHIDPDNAITLDNVGRTTGYGPQIGSGFIVSTPLATFYTYGTLTYGTVSNSPGYKYEAQAFHAGLRFGDAVNIRYEYGQASWAPENRKSTEYNRFTVGLLLTELFR